MPDLTIEELLAIDPALPCGASPPIDPDNCDEALCCADCGNQLGQLHEPGCDEAICPICRRSVP